MVNSRTDGRDQSEREGDRCGGDSRADYSNCIGHQRGQSGQPFADQGETVAIQNADVAIEEPANPMFLFQPGVDLREIVDAVNETGATPSSLIAILEALKSSGSLRAELVVI